MQDRFLGQVEGSTWAELGASLAALTSDRRQVPLSRMRARVQRRRGAAMRWREIANRARDTVHAHCSTLFHASGKFLQGAAEVGGDEMWELFTLYEIESEHLLGRRNLLQQSIATADAEYVLAKAPGKDLRSASQTSYYPEPPKAAPRRWNRGQGSTAVAMELSGCTGIACSSGIIGQSEEVDPKIYDYGAQDVVVRLQLSGDSQPALIYDPACSFCPIGIGVGDLCITRFSLFPKCPLHDSFECESEAFSCGLPLVVVLWELVFGCLSLERAIEFLQKIFNTPGLPAPMAAGASLMLSQQGHGAVVVEWSASQIWILPITGEGSMVVRANHCLADSALSDDETLQDILDESRLRHCEVEEFIACEVSSGRPPPMTLLQVQEALSQPRVQNDSVLATLVITPEDRSLYVRFRLQTKVMAHVEQTVERNLWQHFACQDAGRRKARWSKQ